VTVQNVGKYLGWRLAAAGLDPKGRTTMYSEGTSFTPYPRGAAVDLPIIFAHRDVGNTTCPGDGGYAQMNKIRDVAAAAAKGRPAAPSPTVVNNPPDNSAPGAGALPAGSNEGTVENVQALVAELTRLAENNPLARKWVAEGGETGRLGTAVSSIAPAKGGFEYARFVNGALYSSPGGEVWAVLGEIYKAWQEYGLDTGELGLPTSDEYRVPDGWRSDFEFGSLIFNEATGVVTKVLRAYNDAYEQSMQGQPADIAVPAPEDAAAPAPEPAPEPVPVG